MATEEPENRARAPDENTAQGRADEERLAALRQRLAEEPRSLVFVTLAEELNRVGEHDEAASVAQRGLLSHPDSVAGRVALAVAEAERDHVKEALEQIKRALIIDQENPKALALMGRILLKRGLAKRAVQFLSHAVKLAPTERAYGELLSEARRQAEAAPARPPVFDADAVPANADPWTEDGDDREVDHTVFDPDAVSRQGPNPQLRAKGGSSGKDGSSGPPAEEPTAFAHPLPRPGGTAAKRAKMGGSAAEYSQMMRRLDVSEDDLPSEVEPTVTAAKLPAARPASTEAPAAEASAAPSKPPTVEAPSVRAPPAAPPPPAREDAPRIESVSSDPAKAVASTVDLSDPSARPTDDLDAAPKAKAEPKPVAAKKATPPDPPAAGSGAAPAEAPAASGAPSKRIGPLATRMVDDALWALLGKRGGAEEPAEPSAEAGDKKGPVRARLRSPEAEAEAPGPRVVRTSERFGTWAQVATLTVLSVAGAFIGHWVMLSSAGPGPEVASEEVKGLASDLERGGLAALLAAEEKANALARSAPDLEPLLNGVKAEIYGRRWREFGRDREMLAQARAALDALEGQRPTVEHLAGLVALSTSAVQREPLLDELRRLEREFPESPKVRVLQARLHGDGDRERAALNALFEARALHKEHRGTLLELARWFQRADAAPAALGTYAQLLDRYPLDVEAAIERYVLGQVTGADPDEARAVSLLAGLVRNEDPAVAKDETGRAALAFAIPRLARGQLVEGIEELGRAEAAFPRSAVFKHAVAGAYFAVGELDRAEALYEQAVELAPRARQPRVGLARVRYARAAGLEVDLTREAAKLAKRFKERPEPAIARLPLGTLQLVPGRFQIIRLVPDSSIFPEAAYREAEDPAALTSVNEVALGERSLARGDAEAAVERFRAAVQARPTLEARFGLGRALVARRDHAEAVRTLRAALDADPSNIPGRLALAEALRAREQTIEALDVLEPLDRSMVVVPEGLLWLGKLRTVRGDYEGAVVPLATVVELRPKDADARLAYGEVLHRLRRPDDALSAYEEALRVKPKVVERDDLTPVGLMYLGRAELERSRRRGLALLKRSLEHEDVPVDAHFYLGRALLKRRRTRREGRRQIERYLRLAPDGEHRADARRLLRRR